MAGSYKYGRNITTHGPSVGGIYIRGVDDALKRLGLLDRAFGKDGLDLGDDLRKIASTVKGNVVSEAPLGPTGNLRRGIVAKKFQNPRHNRPGAFVAVDYKIAPHPHLVEYGHITASGSHTAANPFFRRGVQRSGAWVMMTIRKLIERRLSRAAKYKEIKGIR